jgi:glycosyltransferase involved in cell wall biosynthesis
MKISVIIPAFNAEKYIEEAVQSIIAQTYTDWELLICDDCSIDGTFDIISKLSEDHNKIKVFKNENNLKKPLTVQRLIGESSGDLLTFHDADDYSHPERFEKIIKKLKEEPELGMCGHAIERTDIAGNSLGLFRLKESDYEKIKQEMLVFNSIGDASIFIKREVVSYLKVIYRPFFTNSMDYDLALRIIEKFKSSNLTESLYSYRNVPNSISKGVKGYEKLLMPEFAKEFAKQRLEKGTDILTDDNQDELEKLRTRLSLPYLKDKSLYLRKMADFFSYVEMNQSAIQFCKRAVKKAPFKLINWKYYLTSIRKKAK